MKKSKKKQSEKSATSAPLRSNYSNLEASPQKLKEARTHLKITLPDFSLRLFRSDFSSFLGQSRQLCPAKRCSP
jgi:hypothetical protein